LTVDTALPVASIGVIANVNCVVADVAAVAVAATPPRNQQGNFIATLFVYFIISFACPWNESCGLSISKSSDTCLGS
jgi:hypothetical protein